MHSDTGSLDPKSPKTSQFSVIRRFNAIESHASESHYHSYIVATSSVHRLASQISPNRLFRKKLQQNILRMISTEVSSLAAHNNWSGRQNTPLHMIHCCLDLSQICLWYRPAQSSLTTCSVSVDSSFVYSLTDTYGDMCRQVNDGPT
jgi:hypothetical protein